jgi:ArsR family transcriptional regulator
MDERAIQLKSEVLKALAQPTRLKILECLRGGEKCICEIVPVINGEQSNISRHISVMQKSHLIATRKEGVKVMVKVKEPEIFEILDRVGVFLRKQIQEQKRLLARI